MANCLVLGANGFLGSHLVDSLAARGHNIRAFDRFDDQETRFDQNDLIEIIDGEFLNVKDLEDAVNGIDYVFHLVSTTTPISSTENPMVEIDTNIRFSVELFQKCVEAKVKKVIYTSSGGSVYGESNSLKPNENSVTKPISPYAIGKLTIEKFLNYFYHQNRLESISYRIANPYGPRQSLHSRQGVIPIFMHHLIANEPIMLYGDGSMVRDYIFVKDAVQMIANSFEKNSYSLYNLGSGEGHSISEIIDAIESVTELKFKIETVDAPKTFVHTNTLDINRYKSEFTNLNLTPLIEGIDQTWDYIKKETGV